MSTAITSAKHKAFAIPYDLGLSNLVPSARSFEHPDHGRMLLIPHTRDTTRLARNLGYVTPAPILTQYDWAGDTPFATQKTTAALLTMQSRAFVLSEMGTGKTRAALHAVNFLMLNGDAKKILIIAPLSTLTYVWDREIFQYFGHLSTVILHNSSRAVRLKLLQQERDIYIINHDGVETIHEALFAMRFDVVIVDELAVFRNAGTDRWKMLNLLINGGLRKGTTTPLKPVPYAWGLTGSPTPNEPADAWAQCRLLVPQKVAPFYRSFKQRTMMQVSQFKWIARPDAKEFVFDAMQPAVRYKRDDCVELPPTSYQTRPVKLSSEQQRVYTGMIRKLKLAFQEGTVTAANEGVLFSKLLQITSGWVYTSDRKIVNLDCKDRIDNLLEVLDEAEGKVIVFADFIHTAENVYAILQNKYINCRLVTGKTPPNARNRIFTEFQSAAFPRVLVAHPKCMSHGLTLTAASVIVWFTPTTSLETYEQACARITRPGQTRKSLIVHLTGSPVESKLYRRLQQKASLQGALLEMFEAQEIDE
jgi:SNF2 family DNA or RNA helicase